MSNFKNEKQLKEWIFKELSSILTFVVTEDIVDHLMIIESPRDLEDHLKSLLDYSNSSHKKFAQSLLEQKLKYNESLVGYRKQELENYIQTGKPQDKKKKGLKQKNDKKNEVLDTDTKKSNKKTKFVNIFDHDDNILLKGRHMCECEASKHALVNNCLHCGRIVCEQEGPGPCFFCSNPVYGRGNQPNNNSVSNKSLEVALELKNRLLEYDKSSESRTRVIDDESDYFSSNSVWLSNEQKQALQKKEEELQALKHSRTRNLLLDFTGRCIVDDNFIKLNEENRIISQVTDLMDSFNKADLRNDNLDPKSTYDIEPVYDPTQAKETTTGSRWHASTGRVQDKEVMEMSDIGVCLSMHQPWATLLISGIKRHEGRTWYSSHRGRLWIAATAKQPIKSEIEEVQEQYSQIKGEIKFPSKYPVGCLLGCVSVTDCLAQEEYREIYPDGESDSPYVFICEDPTPSPVLFPMKGKHKIYKLDPTIHKAAVQCIQRLSRT